MKTQLRGLRVFPLVLLLSISMGCTRKIYFPVENSVISHDTLRSIERSRDSLIFRDSVIIIRNGDTLENTIIRERWRVRILHDTVSRIVRDTVCRTETKIIPPLESEKTAKGGIMGIISNFLTQVAEVLLSGILLFAVCFFIIKVYQRKGRQN